MINTLLLDAGGVLVDESEYEQIRAEVAVEVLRKVVPGYDLDTYWTDVREAVDRYALSVYRYVVRKHSGRDAAAFKPLYAEYKRVWKPRAPRPRIMPGIGDVVSELAPEFFLAIAGQYGRVMLELLEAHDLLRHFGTSLTQDDFRITKPDPRYYEQILERSGRSAHCSVMVGDRIDKDVIPAKAVGMRTVRVKLGVYAEQRPRTQDETPDLEVFAIDEIPGAVRSLAR